MWRWDFSFLACKVVLAFFEKFQLVTTNCPLKEKSYMMIWKHEILFILMKFDGNNLKKKNKMISKLFDTTGLLKLVILIIGRILYERNYVTFKSRNNLWLELGGLELAENDSHFISLAGDFHTACFEYVRQRTSKICNFFNVNSSLYIHVLYYLNFGNDATSRIKRSTSDSRSAIQNQLDEKNSRVGWQIPIWKS